MKTLWVLAALILVYGAYKSDEAVSVHGPVCTRSCVALGYDKGEVKVEAEFRGNDFEFIPTCTCLKVLGTEGLK